MSRHARLLEACIDEFPGTPEELGEILHDATFPPPLIGDSFFSKEYVESRRSKYQTARLRLMALPHGMDLILAEERANRLGR